MQALHVSSDFDPNFVPILDPDGHRRLEVYYHGKLVIRSWMSIEYWRNHMQVYPDSEVYLPRFGLVKAHRIRPSVFIVDQIDWEHLSKFPWGYVDGRNSKQWIGWPVRRWMSGFPRDWCSLDIRSLFERANREMSPDVHYERFMWRFVSGRTRRGEGRDDCLICLRKTTSVSVCCGKYVHKRCLEKWLNQSPKNPCPQRCGRMV